MRIPLVVRERMYGNETVSGWNEVWEKICKMTYENDTPVSEIITSPGFMTVHNIEYPIDKITQSQYYTDGVPANAEVITMDYMWDIYSKKHGPNMPKPVPELEKLHVPRSLFECLGIHSWFRHSFPNCKITYWEQ